MVQQEEQKKPVEKEIERRDSAVTAVSALSELTESSDESSQTVSTTTVEESHSGETGSYFSEGAWLMSKSEGQILPNTNNNNSKIYFVENNLKKSLFLNTDNFKYYKILFHD